MARRLLGELGVDGLLRRAEKEECEQGLVGRGEESSKGGRKVEKTHERRVQHELVQRLAGRDHREDVLRLRGGPRERERVSPAQAGSQRGETRGGGRTLTTRASKRTGFWLSYSMNSFILAGSSSTESQRMACTPMAFARATKSGFVMAVCE